MSDIIKIKNFCSVKDTVKRIKRQATDWEKIFAKHIICYKGLVFKIYKEILKLNNKEKLNYKISKGSEQTPYQRKYTDGK